LLRALEIVEKRLEAGERGDALIALVASRRVEIPEHELRSACRRAMLVLAAGGDPQREVEPESKAVLVLARDLDAPERRDALRAGLTEVAQLASTLPLTSRLVARLESDPELAWRGLACAYLADELGD
jgi:hypothetical protein